MHSFQVRALGALLICCALPVGARAQVSIATSADVLSGYHWRGLTFTNRPVLQPSITVAAARGGSALSLTAWSNVEPGKYKGARELSALHGEGGFTELDFVLSGTHTLGKATFTAGAQTFLFATPTQGDAVPHTVEVLAGLAWDGRFSPRVTWYQDVASVSGSYIEAGLGLTVPGLSGLTLAGTAGVSLNERGYYERDGLTHLQLDARWPLQLRGAGFTPVLGVIHALDPVTRQAGPTALHSWKPYGGFNVSWAR